jgi:hypothetical protein
MTEREWGGKVTFELLLDACSWLSENKKNQRKLRLWACACCHRLGDLLPDARSRDAVAVAERKADGLANKDEVRTVSKAAAVVPQIRREDATALDWASSAAHLTLSLGLVEGTQTVVIRAAIAVEMSGRATRAAEEQSQVELLRDVFGNPFRPATVTRAWRTTPVTSLAQTMYESRDFSAMPILADALEEAGCDNTELLAHCRGPGPHVRGCWVVDLVLGKK